MGGWGGWRGGGITALRSPVLASANCLTGEPDGPGHVGETTNEHIHTFSERLEKKTHPPQASQTPHGWTAQVWTGPGVLWERLSPASCQDALLPNSSPQPLSLLGSINNPSPKIQEQEPKKPKAGPSPPAPALFGVLIELISIPAGG